MSQKNFRYGKRFCIRFRKLFTETMPENNGMPPEEQFFQIWTQALTEKAEVFNGLYEGLCRVRSGTAKKKEKVFREWWNRTRYQWEGREPERFCAPVFEKLLAEGTEKEYRKWAELLLKAGEAAGITQDPPGEMKLDGFSAKAYTEWDGDTLYPGDCVEILYPAWYQNGRVLEQGICRRMDAGSGIQK